MREEDNRRACIREKEALDRIRDEQLDKKEEEWHQQRARQLAYFMEQRRAARMASRPLPPTNPIDHIEPSKSKISVIITYSIFCNRDSTRVVC